MGMLKRLYIKLKDVTSGAIRQGWSVSKVCWSAAWGIAVGLFPIYGVTTATLGLIGWLGRLNHAVLQACNYVVAPLKLLLILPHIRLGEWIFREDTPFSLSINEFTYQFRASPMDALREFGWTFVHAVAGWMLVAPIFLLVAYVVMHSLVRFGRRAGQNPLVISP